MSSVDPYFDDKFGDLRNLLGVESVSEFRKLEPQIVFANEIELDTLSIPRTNDLAELQLIHKQLFKGVYDWAGAIRTIDIRKNSKGSKFFLVSTKITVAANYIFD